MTSHAARSLAVSLALCAMLLRALLPDGWMPAASAADGVPFVICSVDGSHHDGKAPGEPQQQRTHAPCAFAAAAPLAPPCAASAAPRSVADGTHLSPIPADAAAAVAAPFRPNAARAPPAHA
jgi:hypothetical protein